jgi:hypothetical protein
MKCIKFQGKLIEVERYIYKYFKYICHCVSHTWTQLEEFEDTKGVIIIRISKKNRQHNGQKKKYKRTNNDLQHIKLKIE